jgi:hypothetical protein
MVVRAPTLGRWVALRLRRVVGGAARRRDGWTQWRWTRGHRRGAEGAVLVLRFLFCAPRWRLHTGGGGASRRRRRAITQYFEGRVCGRASRHVCPRGRDALRGREFDDAVSLRRLLRVCERQLCDARAAGGARRGLEMIGPASFPYFVVCRGGGGGAFCFARNRKNHGHHTERRHALSERGRGARVFMPCGAGSSALARSTLG